MSFNVFQLVDQRLEFFLIAKDFLNDFVLSRLAIKRLKIQFVNNLAGWNLLLNFNGNACQVWNVVRIAEFRELSYDFFLESFVGLEQLFDSVTVYILICKQLSEFEDINRMLRCNCKSAAYCKISLLCFESNCRVVDFRSSRKC